MRAKALVAAAAPPPEAADPAVAAPPEEHRNSFYALSVALTGFDRQELLGTGAGHVYLAWLLRAFGDLTADLLKAWHEVEAGSPPDEREAHLRERVLGDPKLGPFARGVIYLWYTATWSTEIVGAEWSKAYGLSPENQNRAFGTAYPEGLMWKVSSGPHPGGAKPTGFGTWAFAPEEEP
jgi:hypothetical protein